MERKTCTFRFTLKSKRRTDIICIEDVTPEIAGMICELVSTARSGEDITMDMMGDDMEFSLFHYWPSKESK